MKLHLDKDSDALYLLLDDDDIVESEEVSPGVVLDFDGHDRVIGVEILGISTRFPNMRIEDIQLTAG